MIASSQNILSQIKAVCSKISDDELTKLRLEEELLITLVKCQKQNLTIKKEAFQRITDINKKQLTLIGESQRFFK